MDYIGGLPCTSLKAVVLFVTWFMLTLFQVEKYFYLLLGLCLPYSK